MRWGDFNASPYASCLKKHERVLRRSLNVRLYINSVAIGICDDKVPKTVSLIAYNVRLDPTSPSESRDSVRTFSPFIPP